MRDALKLLKAFSWEESVLDYGIIILPKVSHATPKHAETSLKEINNLLVPLLSQYYLWVLKDRIEVLVVDWRV